MEFQDPMLGVLACAATVQLVDLIAGKIQMYDQQSGVIMSPRTPEAGDHGGTTGQPKWNGRRRFLGLGAERYRPNRELIIDGEPHEPDRSRKE